MENGTCSVEYIEPSTGGYWCNNCQRYHFDPYHFCVTVSPRQGWQCPICKVIHSPDTHQCRCQVNPYSINIGYHTLHG